MPPKVLISDALSPAAVAIFKDRGLEVDFQPEARQGQGQARRGDQRLRRAGDPLGHQGHGQDSGAGAKPESDRPRRHRRRQCRYSGGDRARHHRDEHAVRQFDHHRRACHHADAGAGAANPEADASTRAGKWEKNKFLGVEIFGKTLGVIGCGNIGSIVADRALGLKMKVIAYDPFLSDRARASISASRKSSSTICCAAPTSSRCTRRSPTRPATSSTPNSLKLTKKGVRLINCARGGLVDEAALYEALTSGRVAGAALDVFATEPATRQSAVRAAERGLHAASRRLDHRGAGKRRAAGRRADVGLSAARRHHQRRQLPLDQRRGSAEAEAVHGAGGKARLVRRPAHRDRHQAGADLLRGRGRADEHAGADLGGDRRPAAPDAAGRQRRLGADRRQGSRHRRSRRRGAKPRAITRA